MQHIFKHNSVTIMVLKGNDHICSQFVTGQGRKKGGVGALRDGHLALLSGIGELHGSLEKLREGLFGQLLLPFATLEAVWG